jgi:peptidoglycan/xylan/chitin deacetylase (PgdA/CDA1 family)
MPARHQNRNRSVFLLFLIASVLGLALTLPRLYVAPVLMYHMIGYPQNERMRANTVSPESFRKQLSYIKKRGYLVLSLDEYYEGLKAGKNFCCRSVVFTFDDGMLDNYTAAFPILREHGFQAAFFVPTEKIGMEGRMTWGQLREASASGITVGSHLLNEEYLPDLPLAAQEREIVESKRAIESRLGRPAYYLAYPIGGFTEDVKKFTRQAGYRLAFTTNRGFARFNRDLFELKRIRPTEMDNDFTLWWKLTGYYNLLRSSKKPF